MHDDDVPTDLERRLRAALRPDDERVRRVIEGALSSRSGTDWLRRFPLVAAGTAGLVVIVAALVWYEPASAPSGLHISGSGSVIVVTSDDGRRWMVDTDRSSEVRGAYVIVFPQ
jgi:hypothetical protein